jgi:hypothetical protein
LAVELRLKEKTEVVKLERYVALEYAEETVKMVLLQVNLGGRRVRYEQEEKEKGRYERNPAPRETVAPIYQKTKTKTCIHHVNPALGTWVLVAPHSWYYPA